MSNKEEKEKSYEARNLNLTGDLEEQFKQIYDLFHKKVFNYIAKSINNREEAMDVLQEVFLLFYNKLPTLDISTSRIESWLLKVARNLAMTHSRKRYKRPLTGLNENLAVSRSKTDELFKRKDLNERMATFLASLNERERSIFILHKIENVKYKDLKEIFNISTRTLKRVIHGVFAKLKETELFDEDDIQ